MPDRVRFLVARTQAMLNFIIIAHKTLTWLALAAAVSAGTTVFLYVLAILGFGPPKFSMAILWAAIIVLGTTAGAIKGARKRLDERGAARWLDLRLGTQELFQSALLCMQDSLLLKRSGAFGEAVLDRAESFSEKIDTVSPPWKALVRRTLLAAAVVLASWFVLGFADAAFIPRNSDNGMGEPVNSGDSGIARAAGGTSSPEAIARSVFPENGGLAEQAEKAIRAGRLDEFKNLLKRADLDLGDKLERSVNDTERKRLREQRERLAEIAKKMEEGSLADTVEGGEDSVESPDGANGDMPGGSELPGNPRGGNRGPTREGDDSLSGDPGAKQGMKADSGGNDPENPMKDGGEFDKNMPEIIPKSGNGQAASGPGKANAKPGSGLSSPRDWGPVAPRAAGPEAVVKPDEKAPYFMYILPGSAPGERPVDMLANARRGAEAAVARKSIPVDYEEFVKSYFLELLKMASPEGGGKGERR